MTQDERDRMETLESLVQAHTALFGAAFAILRSRGGLTPSDIDAVFDAALLGIETSERQPDAVSRQARRFLEGLASRPETKG